MSPLRITFQPFGKESGTDQVILGENSSTQAISMVNFENNWTYWFMWENNTRTLIITRRTNTREVNQLTESVATVDIDYGEKFRVQHGKTIIEARRTRR